MYAAVATALSTMPATANAIRTAMRVDLWQDGERHVDGHADHDHVRDGPDARPLAQRDPGQQHEHADDAGDQAEAQVELAGDALMQHVPRHDAELRLHEQSHRHAVEHEPDEELRQPTRHAPARGRGGERGRRRHQVSSCSARDAARRANFDDPGLTCAHSVDEWSALDGPNVPDTRRHDDRTGRCLPPDC